jgi:hypothetical protein
LPPGAAVRACAWTGPLFVLMFLVGAVPLSRFFAPPTSAQGGAGEIAAMYTDNLGAIRIGILLMCLASPLFATFAMAIATMTRPSDPEWRVVYHSQIALIGVGTFVILLIPVAWAVAAYRPGMISPDVTQSWNDFAWFGVLFTWPPFGLWCLLIAASILFDAQPRLPRWVGYLNVWTCVGYIPASCMIFTKTGPLAQNGVITFWIPIVVFFLWTLIMSAVVIRHSRR